MVHPKLTLADLRSRAEKLLEATSNKSSHQIQDFDELFHELNVYHAELEIQLEDLQQSYLETDTAKHHYATLFDHAPAGYILLNRDGFIISGNATIHTMLHLKPKTLTMKRFAEYIAVDYQDVFHLHRRTVLQTQQGQNCEVMLIAQGGKSFYVQLNTDVQDAETLLMSIVDVSARKRTEIALQNALAHEKEMSELRSRVLSVIQHEFRTPLTVILSSVEILDHYSARLTPENRKKRFQTIRNLVWYLNDMVHNASNFNVVDDEPILNPIQFDALAFIRQIVTDLQITAHNDQVIDLAIIAPEETHLVTWDQHLLRAIITNLLSNALKYSTETVIVQVDYQEEFVFLAVNDRGDGISEENQKHIYQPFYRGDKSTFIQGMGIGLYVVKRAVEAHGGTITCQSVVGVGTTFVIKLPHTISAHNARND